MPKRPRPAASPTLPDLRLHDERSTERMHFRLPPRIKAAIQQAAALRGVDDSVFTLQAAYQAALETIRDHEQTVLQPDDHAAFLAALDAPPPPTEALREAFARYQHTVTSR